MFLSKKLTYLYRSILALAVTSSFLLCLFQVENFTNKSLPVNKISINNTNIPSHDSHIPQVCNLVSQKYNSQNNNILDFLISEKNEIRFLYNNLYVIASISYSQITIDDKIYIKNVTLLV